MIYSKKTNRFIKYSIIFIFLIMLITFGIFIGLQLANNNYLEFNSNKNNNEKFKNSTGDKNINLTITKTTSYNSTSPSIDFRCYKKDNLIIDNKIEIIFKHLTRNQRDFYELCKSNNSDSKIIVSSTKSGTEKKRNLSLDIYDFYDDTNYSFENLLSENDLAGRVFHLQDWKDNQDLIFNLSDNYNTGVYAFNLSYETYYQPTLIEICSINASRHLGISYLLGDCFNTNKYEESRFIKDDEFFEKLIYFYQN